MRDIVTAAPSAWPIIEGINNSILNGDLYQALKEAKKLIAYEKKLLGPRSAGRPAPTLKPTALDDAIAHIASGGDCLDIEHDARRKPARCAPNSSTAATNASISQTSVR